MQCANNLRQIGTAVYGYADATPMATENGMSSALPAGTVANANMPLQERLSWYVQLLPYLEQESVFRLIDRGERWDGPVNAAATQTLVKLFICNDWANEADGGASIRTPYVGSAGVGVDAGFLAAAHPRAGALGYDRRLRLAQATDGQSNTLLLLETGDNPGPWAQGGLATLRPLDPARQPYLGPGRPFGATHFSQRGWFNSQKPIGFHVLLLDGSTRFLRHEVSATLLETLATVAGGDQPGANWY